MLSSSVIIATRNRPGPLEEVIFSLKNQLLAPREVFIIDSSDSDATAQMVEKRAPELDFPLRYQRSDKPSAAHQRNLGARQASGDLVVFLDDDVDLDPGFLQELTAPFVADAESAVAGVSGRIVNQTYSQPRGLNWLLLALCLGDFRRNWAGRLVGPAVNFLPPDIPEGVHRVEWLFSTGTAYRREPFLRYEFGRQFEGYSFAEDVHLSARMAKDWVLLHTTAARFFHHDLGKDTHRDWAALGESQVRNRSLIMTSVMGRNGIGDHLRLFAFEILYFSISWIAGRMGPGRVNRLGSILRGKLRAFREIWAWYTTGSAGDGADRGAGVNPMGDPTPLVTILIATKDRPDDLRFTLKTLRRQDYPAVELIVIDDASTENIEPIVREHWPEADYWREAVSRGCPQRRSEGFLRARGEYILEIDDDSAPVDAQALTLAVSWMNAHPSVGILGFHIFNGPVLPEGLPRPDRKYSINFVGCGALFRTSAVRQAGGYRDFFNGEFEESEYVMRMMKAGWSVYFFPDVLVHHRVSPIQRRAARSWMRAFRNKIWAQVMLFPLHRLAAEASWTLALAFWDSIRLLRPHYLIQGLVQCAAGLPRALRLRDPMPAALMSQYDALRFGNVMTEEDLRSPPKFHLADLWDHFRRRWANRPRQRSFWDRRPGDTGSSSIVAFAHEFTDQSDQAGGNGR